MKSEKKRVIYSSYLMSIYYRCAMYVRYTAQKTGDECEQAASSATNIQTNNFPFLANGEPEWHISYLKRFVQVH